MPTRAQYVLQIVSELKGAFGDCYDEINEHTLIVRDYTGDEEELSYFFGKLSEALKISDPPIPNMYRYIRDLWCARGFQVSDLHRYLTKKPEIDVRTLTVGQLADVAVSGQWPPELVYPYNERIL